MNSKFIIYQMLPRLFANGKLADISTDVLAQLKKLSGTLRQGTKA